MEHEIATTTGQSIYHALFTLFHDPARHDKEQTILTDYIADETPEWYEEVHRVAPMIEEGRICTEKQWNRVDETERNRNKLKENYSKLYETPHTHTRKKTQRNQ
jgi:hypothetical protein